MNYRYPLDQNFLLDGLVEYATMKNFNGNSDIHEDYFSASLIGEIYKNWNATFGYANRKNIRINQNGYDQNLAEISFGYTFDKNRFFDSLLMQTGYRNLRYNYKTSIDQRNAYGALVRYMKHF
jgi:hypothetical protein